MAHRFKVVKGGPYPHFVTMSIVRWFPIFVSGQYFRIVLDSLQHLRENRGLAVNAYVIMPTHIHAILTATNDDLSAIVRDFKKFTARNIYHQAEQDGDRLAVWIFEQAAKTLPEVRFKVWQDEFHPEAIYSREFLLQKADYIHANPVRKGLAGDPSHWYYSSFRTYEGAEDGPLEIDELEW